MNRVSDLRTMCLKTGLFLASVILLLGASTFAQEKSFGDESVKEGIKKKTSAIYKDRDKMKFFLTRKLPRIETSCGMEITAFSKNSKLNRLVVRTCGKKGKQSTEFYFEEEKLIYAYQVFEFFEENAKADFWRNFKGIASWESRFYFVNSQLKFHSHKGRKKISSRNEENRIKEEAKTIFGYVKTRL